MDLGVLTPSQRTRAAAGFSLELSFGNTMTPSAIIKSVVKKNHVITVSQERILSVIGEGLTDANHFTRSHRLIRLLLRTEIDQQSIEMRQRLDTIVHACERQIPIEQREAESTRLTDDIRAILIRANYVELSEKDLQTAFTTQSLIRLNIQINRKLWNRSVIFARGRHLTSQTVSAWFGLRKKTIQIEVFDRLFFYVEHQPKPRARQKSDTANQPPSFYVRLFENIPVADMEMLFPNCAVGMRNLDKCIMFGPAIFAVIGISAVIRASWLALYGSARWQLGIDTAPPDVPGGALAAIGGGLVALIIWGDTQFSRYQKMRLKYLKILADMILYRMLDRDMGAAARVLDEASEEESKEAILGYRFLLDGPSTADALDAKIESWLQTQFQVEVDFEVNDALAKLHRLGIASCSNGVWTAKSPSALIPHLLTQWNALAE